MLKNLLKKLPRYEVTNRNPLTTQALWVHLALIAVTLFALGICLWLFLDISASQKQFRLILLQSIQDDTVFQKINSIYEQEIWLDLLLLLPILILGLMVLGFVSFYFKTTRRLKEVRSIDNYILQSITRGVLTTDRKSKITSCNLAMQDILGICREECHQEPIESVLPANDPILKMLSSTSDGENRREEEEEITYTRTDGKMMPLRVTISALHDEENRSIGNIILVKDLSPIRSLEEKVRRQERFAALGHLTRRIIHEIRNPLSAMDMNLQLLQEYLEEKLRVQLDDRVRRYLSVVFSELHRLDAILRNTHLSVHPPAIERSKLDLHQVIQEVTMKMQAEVESAGHELLTRTLDRPVYILGDKNLLIQVFINMFKNSVEAMKDKAGRIRLSSHINNKNQIIIKIEDTGRGVEWQNLSRIFDPYFTTKAKGTGLGLSIVHNIVSQHGGEINVVSWVGEGTVFELSFPLVEECDQG